MCLLDSVTHWTGQQIHCTSSSHLAANNPLRADGRLGAACGIEYAAQAMAVHGVLLVQAAQGPLPKRGYLVSVRSVTLATDRLDTVPGPLEIEAERLSGDSTTVLYQFNVRSADRLLLSGRAAVVLDSENL